MMPLDRRDVLKGALVSGIAMTRPELGSAQENAEPAGARPWQVIDTNVNLFQWPFRRLPFDRLDQFVEKLRSLSIIQAWAGSFEGILHRDLSAVNLRLAKVCRDQTQGLMIPFGSVNPTLPDWEEDLRRCREEYHMPGIRLHPNYHGYALDDARLQRLLELASDSKMLVQLAVAMEDTRTQHPLLRVADVDLGPLPKLLQEVPSAKVMLLNYRPRGAALGPLAATPGLYFDIARVEATDGVARILRSVPTPRVVYGSHAPFLINESSLIRVDESDLSETKSRAVLQRNAERLLAERLAE